MSPRVPCCSSQVVARSVRLVRLRTRYRQSMSQSRITELRMTTFKSYQEASLPLAPMTVLIGRNGSGKSNALDALDILAQLARGEEVRDALDGDRHDLQGVRGGADGAAMHGVDAFRVGVEILIDDCRAWLDVNIQVRPDVRIVAEEFWLGDADRWMSAPILSSLDADPERTDLEAAVWNGKPGRNPVRLFRSSHLLTGQLVLRLEGKTKQEGDILRRTQRALAVLGGVYHLDPVPHLMRDYVPAQDSELRRTGQNLSAAVARLKHDRPERFAELVDVIRRLPESDVRSLDLGRGGFGDVMLALNERKGRSSVKTPARQMSDGMLRMIAVATAVLSGSGGLDLETDVPGNSGLRPACLVIEELENGLHPSQAAMLLDLVKRSWRDAGFQVILSSHSPALLDALDGDDHQGVLVCERDRTSGASTVTRLVDLPGYLQMMANDSLGGAVTSGRIAQAAEPARSYAKLNRLLGIG